MDPDRYVATLAAATQPLDDVDVQLDGEHVYFTVRCRIPLTAWANINALALDHTYTATEGADE